MFDFHGDKQRYFNLTRQVTQEYIYPYLQQQGAIKPGMKVLEIGCGEAGVLSYFASQGHSVFGIELEQSRIDLAQQFLASEVQSGQARFLNKDIYDVDIASDIGHTFDLIILKDVIEHIPQQSKFIPQLHRYLSAGGMVFMAFPPWQMPYGGHQQILSQKWAARLPYYHILPSKIYTLVLKSLGVPANSISTMQFIKSTGISIERFEKICAQSNFKIVANRHYLFNPIYKYKFGIKPLRQSVLLKHIPYLRNWFTMGVYYLIKPVQ